MTKTDDHGAFAMLDLLGDNLDPARLIPLVPLKPSWPRKKGQPVNSYRPFGPVAKTGLCGFSTSDSIPPGDANAHVEFLLRAIEPHAAELREIVAGDGLTWSAILFEGSSPGQFFSDLRPELLSWSARLGLPLVPKGEEKVTFVFDTKPDGW